ncbi:SAM-dependent methyltransferase [Nostoc sp. T09]|uniref:SAM-dependent methyltransferase n=1 Tax=Nostoc sp. T09 TaxID=1932621 RepID=UPI000A376021|nr:class I SAM-dependent methyltransferase [Nostoc sp. T09]OUL37164.1 SAM-dependent methyltransferase [Nostoc sp. T09]
MEPRGAELINRYKRIYRFSEEIEITEEMILRHWELEKKLTKEILDSQPENRWEISERAYTVLYSELEWLNKTPEDTRTPAEKYQTWVKTIGCHPKKIYEVGSGKGELIAYLAKCEYECKGTEITRERGSKHVNDSSPYLSWGNSDGIHLDSFEPAEFYDVVLSNQVIEHFHPDDLNTHFKSAHIILNQSGRYIFTTPHCHTGPHDVSLVFKYDNPQGMHLKEYTYLELAESLSIAGFHNVYCAVPTAIRKLLGKIGIQKDEQIISIGSFYLNFMVIVEKIIFLLPKKNLRRLLAKNLRKIYLFADNIFLVAQK